MHPVLCMGFATDTLIYTGSVPHSKIKVKIFDRVNHLCILEVQN